MSTSVHRPRRRRSWVSPTSVASASPGPTPTCPCWPSIRERFAKERPLDGVSGGGLPARHDRDRQPAAHAQGGRGRGARSARRTRCRPRTTWPPRSSSTRASPPTPSRARTPSSTSPTSTPLLDRHPTMTMDDGCDLVSRIHKTRPDQVAESRGRHRGDDHRGHPAAGHGGRGGAQVPDRGGQRRRHQAHVRQPLRHGPVHPRRHHPRHQRAVGRQAHRGGRLRLLRQGRGQPGPRAWAPRSSSPRSTRCAPSRRSWTASGSSPWRTPPPKATSSSP